MLSHLTPAVELTGGPWFTDNELDLDFVEMLKKLCLKFIEKKVRYDERRRILAKLGSDL